MKVTSIMQTAAGTAIGQGESETHVIQEQENIPQFC
jgi:hypothetical protein